METRTLYEQDAELRVFEARVLSCRPRGEGYAVVLDRTAFFPEGGGQPADQGFLGEARVLDVHITGGEITHCTDKPLDEGAVVRGEVDDARRMEMTQQHSGEHIFSGLTHREFGYDNVGFHIGRDAVTMDFNGPMTREDALRIERMANEVIWRNVPIEVFVPAREELRQLEYRSKKEIDGDVRIVRIEGADCCACCGTHFARTGSIGQIKVIGIQNYKGGVRVSILCGVRALAWEDGAAETLRETAALLNGKQEETAERVARLLQERDSLRHDREMLALRLFETQAQAEKGPVRVVSAAAPMGQPGKAAAWLAGEDGTGMALSPQEDGWRFALCSPVRDVRPATRALIGRFGGKGGGPADLTQGILCGGTEAEIRAVLTETMA